MAVSVLGNTLAVRNNTTAARDARTAVLHRAAHSLWER
jgi:hypothetical protein